MLSAKMAASLFQPQCHEVISVHNTTIVDIYKTIMLPSPRADDPHRLGKREGSQQGVGPLFRQKIPLF